MNLVKLLVNHHHTKEGFYARDPATNIRLIFLVLQLMLLFVLGFWTKLWPQVLIQKLL